MFVQLFGAGDTPEERATIARHRASVVDMILGRTSDLKRELGPADQRVLDDYLESVRETERRIAKASGRDLSGVDLPDTPIGELPDFDEQVKLMFDLIHLAYQANVTRVASYAWWRRAQPHLQRRRTRCVPPVSHHATTRSASGKP